MSKFHIKKDGTPGTCHATKNCPLGGEDSHYSTMEEAQTAAQEKLANTYGLGGSSEFTALLEEKAYLNNVKGAMNGDFVKHFMKSPYRDEIEKVYGPISPAMGANKIAFTNKYLTSEQKAEAMREINDKLRGETLDKVAMRTFANKVVREEQSAKGVKMTPSERSELVNRIENDKLLQTEVSNIMSKIGRDKVGLIVADYKEPEPSPTPKNNKPVSKPVSKPTAKSIEEKRDLNRRIFRYASVAAAINPGIAFAMLAHDNRKRKEEDLAKHRKDDKPAMIQKQEKKKASNAALDNGIKEARKDVEVKKTKAKPSFSKRVKSMVAKGIFSEQEGKDLIAKGSNTSSKSDPLDNDDYWSIH